MPSDDEITLERAQIAERARPNTMFALRMNHLTELLFVGAIGGSVYRIVQLLSPGRAEPVELFAGAISVAISFIGLAIGVSTVKKSNEHARILMAELEDFDQRIKAGEQLIARQQESVDDETRRQQQQQRDEEAP